MHRKQDSYGCDVLARAASADTGYVGASLRLVEAGGLRYSFECWSAAELGPRSRRARDRRAAPPRGGMRRNILQAKTLLTHPSGRRLSFSRYWARLKPRSESLARYVSCIQSSCILNATPAVLKPAQACTVCASLWLPREKTRVSFGYTWAVPGIVGYYLVFSGNR